MRRFLLGCLILIGLGSISAFAQVSDDNMFAKTVYIYKVYPHTKGYVVQYHHNNNEAMSLVHIPFEWFNAETAGAFDGTVKAELRYSTNNAVPYMTIYWRNGEFAYLTLFVKPTMNDTMWGVLKDPDAETDKFVVDQNPTFTFR